MIAQHYQLDTLIKYDILVHYGNLEMHSMHHSQRSWDYVRVGLTLNWIFSMRYIKTFLIEIASQMKTSLSSPVFIVMIMAMDLWYQIYFLYAVFKWKCHCHEFQYICS